MTSSNYLVIILHGYTAKTSSYDFIRQRVEKAYPNAEIFVPALGLSTFSSKDPNQIVSSVITLIDEKWKPNRPILLIGHSCGALLARKVYVYACGENEDAPFELSGFTKPRPWCRSVERVILMAGMNRGWSVNPHLSFFNALTWEFGILISDLLSIINYKVFIMRLKKGAPFITQLRIQWLSMLDKIQVKETGNSIVIQLLGTIDDLVSPDDNIDMVTAGDFFYLEVPMSGHRSVLDMDETEVGEERARIFNIALTNSREELYKLQADSYVQKIVQQPKVTDVIFVIHGIRDAGYWTKKVARRVQEKGKLNSRIFEPETSSYGYFPMLPFLLYPTRRAKVEWLMDQYTENRSIYPNADFSYIGHSNGTYLLAKALEDYPACRFKNVVFAGSVVRQSYDWRAMITANRIKVIVNLVASADWVVAIFPKAFQTLHIQDLGSGGHDGFSTLSSPGTQIRFIKGGHGAGIKEQLWNTIANIIVNGPSAKQPIPNEVPKQDNLIRALGSVAPLIIASIVAILIIVGYYLIWRPLSPNPHAQVLFILLYVFGLWKIVTKM